MRIRCIPVAALSCALAILVLTGFWRARCTVGQGFSLADRRAPATLKGRPTRLRCVPVAALSCVLAILALTGCDRPMRWAVAVPSVPAERLHAWLREPAPPLVFDLRSLDDYRAAHVPGAVSLTAQDVEGFLARTPPPPATRVVLVCSHGRLSQLAAASAAARHPGAVYDLAGGMAAWQARGLPVERGNGPGVAHPGLPVISLGPGDQALAYVSAVVVKPAYMLLSLLLIIWLWRRDGQLRKLRWGLLLFLTGETFCALNFYFGKGGVIEPIDLLHGAGMVMMGALVPWALFRIADERVLRYGDPRQVCAAQRFCGRCWKRQGGSCGLHRLFMAMLPGLAACSLLPLSAPLRPMHYIASVAGNVVPYGMPVLNGVVELWGYGVAGALAFLATLVALRGGPESTRRAELPFFLGVGFASFAVMRFLLGTAFQGAVHWGDFWEEMTEFIAIATIGLLLVFFKQPLSAAQGHDPA